MVTIRPCTADDFERIFALLRQLWPDRALCHARLQGVYERTLQSDAQHYLCAVEEDRIIGFCSIALKNNLRVEGTLANLDEIVVHHANRGRGIGTQLLQATIAFAREHGSTRIELESALHRVETHAYYESRGFHNRAYYFSMPLV